MITPRIKSPLRDSLRSADIFALCMRHWWWFAISLVICISAGTLYLLKTPKLYQRNAQILIKDDNKGKSVTPGISDFSDFGILSPNTNFYDEIIVLWSADLMTKVIERLNLQTNYTTPLKFRQETLYGKSLPVLAEMPDLDKETEASFILTLCPRNTYILSSFRSNLPAAQINDTTIQGHFTDFVDTPIGRVKISPSGTTGEIPTDMIITVTHNTLMSTLNKYREALTVDRYNDKTGVINLTVDDVSIQRAEDILSTVIAIYNENWMRDKNQIAVSTSMFIKDRLEVIESELGNVDADISSYKSEHLVPDVGKAADIAMNEANNAESMARNLEIELSMAKYLRNYLVNEANRSQPLSLSSGPSSLNISPQLNEYNAILKERNSLLANSSESNPLVVEMDKQLTGLRNALLSAIDNQIVALNTQIKGVRGSITKANTQIASNPQQSKYILAVERQQKVKESLYLYLLQKREENELSQAFTAYNTRMVTSPMGSNAPISPSTPKVLLSSLLIGLFLPIAAIYSKETFNRKVRGRKDLENLTVPIIGEIPQNVEKTIFHWNNKKGEKGPEYAIVVKEDCRNMINEAFRVVRTNLEFMLGPDKGENVIAITSANPCSGKTFISYNLGLALAIKKKRVLLIDLDMRKASLSRYIHKPRPGITDYLIGKCDWIYDTLYQSEEGNGYMDIIPVGSIPPNPTELLFNRRLKRMVEELKPHYDYVIIDCPPIEMVADADIINKLVDITIFVIRAGLLERSMLSDVENYYQNKRLTNMSVILNGTDASTTKFGYRYAYKYGYSPGY